MKTKLCRPLLVETKESNLYTIDEKLYQTNWKNIIVSETEKLTPQQLILISLDPDEKIEEGDLMYKAYIKGYDVVKNGKIVKSVITNGLYNHKTTTNPWYSDGKKVIATQDQIPPEYIQQFIEEYNKGEVKDVEIEMENYSRFANVGIPPRKSLCSFPNEFRPKLTNGFVTIVEKKSITYTEKEVYELTKEAVGLWRKSLHTTKLYRNKEHHGKWWNEIKKK